MTTDQLEKLPTGFIPPESTLDSLYERLKKIKDVKTPSSQIKMKGKFQYANYSYMLAEFQKAHPMYRMEIEPSGTFFNEKYLVYHASVKISDILTGECRVGVGLHAIVAYNSRDSGGSLKPINEVRELMSNAYKASLTEAIRNCISNFDICADLYDSQLQEPPSEEQIEKIKYADSIIRKLSLPQFTSWWDEVIKGWNTQTQESANDYIKTFMPTINQLIEKYREKL